MRHCWRILRNAPKWAEHAASYKERVVGKKSKKVAEPSDSGQAAKSDASTPTRGPSIKKVKANDKRLDRLEEMYSSIANRRQESSIHEKRLVEAMEERNELEMLKTDPSTITDPTARQIFDLKMKALLKRYQQEAEAETPEQ